MPKLSINNQLAIGFNQILNAYANGTFDFVVINNAINNISGIRVDEIKLIDLMFCAFNCNGVYFFCDKDNVLISKITDENALNDVKPTSNVVYVGKTSSRSFIERIAAHFAPRNWDFMNVLMQRITDVIYKNIIDETICDSYEIATELYLKVVYFDKRDGSSFKGKIEDLEDFLIDNYLPILNKIAGHRNKMRK